MPMKEFYRDNQLLSLCGLNCGLCPMHLGSHCPGCGGGSGNQSCKIARCSLENNKVEYCFECHAFPCKKYKEIDDFDSFITHKNQRADLEKAKRIGIDAYNIEQTTKIELLNYLLSHFNDGRRKSFFCLAVNLLDLKDIQQLIMQIRDTKDLNMLTRKEQAKFITSLFQDTAKQKNIELKLRKK